MREGYHSDKYFQYSRDVLRADGKNPDVTVQVFAKKEAWLGYAAHIAGAIGVSTAAQASWWGSRGMGTIPHALIACYGGDTVAARREIRDGGGRRDCGRGEAGDAGRRGRLTAGEVRREMRDGGDD
jgi:nicotinic acid phosphoribosyltransferase